MKINNSGKIKFARFADLPTGQVVFYRDDYYIITDTNLIVKLSDGTTWPFYETDIVVPVEAELNIL